MGKVMTQFKSFSFQHAKLINDTIFKELKRGNPGPLLRGVLMTATLGEVIVDLKKLAKLENPLTSRKDQGIVKRQMEHFFQLGSIGLFADLLQSAQFGTKSVLGFVGGPTISTAAKLGSPLAGELGRPFTRGKAPRVGVAAERVSKTLTGEIPIIGRPLKKVLFPKKKKESGKKRKNPFEGL